MNEGMTIKWVNVLGVSLSDKAGVGKSMVPDDPRGGSIV